MGHSDIPSSTGERFAYRGALCSVRIATRYLAALAGIAQVHVALALVLNAFFFFVLVC